MKHGSIAAVAASFVCAAPAAALDFINDDVSIGGKLCVGAECTSNEPFVSGEVISLEADLIRVRFSDTSSGSFPLADWAIDINDQFNGGDNYYAIRDVNLGTQPFKIRDAAPSHALTIAPDGDIGMGTLLPVRDLHIVTTTPTATIRLEENVGTTQIHELSTNNDAGFRISDGSTNTQPFRIVRGAPSDTMLLSSDGFVGIGTANPDGRLHMFGAGVQLAYFESFNGGPVQIRMRSDSQNRRFLALNNANEVKSQMVFGDNQIQFLGQTAANEWLRISSAGIVSSGPTCNPNPCDATFDPEAFTVPPIEERAALMWENMHLPAVGPTEPGAPFNLTEKTAGMLHELEIAHIYIEQLHDEILTLRADHSAALAAQAADLQELRKLIEAN